MGNPVYEVTQGEILLDGENVLEMEVDERARAGLFLAVQYPSEIQGITNATFMRAAMNARRDDDNKIGVREFITKLDENMSLLDMDPDMAERYLNEGFSGGEKKRNEILQLLMIQPTFAILDEIDSGLDIDALQVVSKGINAMRGVPKRFWISLKCGEYPVSPAKKQCPCGEIIENPPQSAAF